MSVALGIFGGTFDPVHYGHLRAAEEVRIALGPGELRLLPAGDPPHREPPGADAKHRLAMLELAVAEFPGLAIDAREVARTGRSYTVLTLRELRAEMPARPLLLVIGTDTFMGLPTWYCWKELFELAHLLVITRPGVSVDGALPPLLDREWKGRAAPDLAALEAGPAGAIFHMAVTPQPISATAIRRTLALGTAGVDSVRGLLPAAVLAYIGHHRLYQRLDRAT